MNLILIAPPAAGKGTQAKLIAKYYQIPHISVGELLREKAKKNSEINQKLSKGILIDDEIVLDILKARLTKTDVKKGFILDGYPRNIKQAQALEKLNLSIKKVIFLETNQEKSIARMKKRQQSSKYKHLTKRNDDNEKTFNKRFAIYEQETKSIIEYYRQQGLLLTVNGNLTINKVFDEIKRGLND